MKLKIGIFDSGICGFTILNSLLKTRRDLEVFYLADTKRVPFGNKDFKQIRLKRLAAAKKRREEDSIAYGNISDDRFCVLEMYCM